MTVLGEIKRGKEIGKKLLYCKFIWHACEDCGRERWTQIRRTKPIHLHCNRCARLRQTSLNHPNWKTGTLKTSQGYVRIWTPSTDPFFSMADSKGYIPEHRLVIAKSLNRCLSRKEYVHHINGIRDDNRFENLQLLSRSNHEIYTKLCGHCSLRKEIRLLRWEIRELKTELQGKLIV